MSLLDPLKHALAAVLAAAHDGLTALGADPAAGGTWLLCVAAVVVGVTLAGSGYVGGGTAHLAVIAGLAVTAASLSYVTQRYVLASNTVTEGLPEAMVTAQRVMPLLRAGGMVVAGGVVPVALLAYWVCNSAWTLGQSAAVAHWFPTPGTAAYARRAG